MMDMKVLVALALAALAGCTPEDDGSADFAKGEAAYAVRDLRAAAAGYGAAADSG